jgi:hypothetical protein
VRFGWPIILRAESAFGADLAARDQQIRSLSVMIMTSGS